MKRVILLFVSLAVMAFQLLFAQSFTVKGKVIAEEGNEPLIGVEMCIRDSNYRGCVRWQPVHRP